MRRALASSANALLLLSQSLSLCLLLSPNERAKSCEVEHVRVRSHSHSSFEQAASVQVRECVCCLKRIAAKLFSPSDAIPFHSIPFFTYHHHQCARTSRDISTVCAYALAQHYRNVAKLQHTCHRAFRTDSTLAFAFYARTLETTNALCKQSCVLSTRYHCLSWLLYVHLLAACSASLAVVFHPISTACSTLRRLRFPLVENPPTLQPAPLRAYLTLPVRFRFGNIFSVLTHQSEPLYTSFTPAGRIWH